MEARQTAHNAKPLAPPPPLRPSHRALRIAPRTRPEQRSSRRAVLRNPSPQGYKLMFHDQLVTVWSAPNYCYRCGNVAAILELDESLNRNFKVFEAAPQEVRRACSVSRCEGDASC